MAADPGGVERVRRVLIVVAIAIWWLALVEVALLAGSWLGALPGARATMAGWRACIHQPNMEAWPIPVDRVAFDEFQRGVRESDEELIERAFRERVWFSVSHGQAVVVTDVDEDVLEIELLTGPHTGSRGWLRPRNLARCS